MTERLAQASLIAVFVTMPLSTGAHEVTMAVAMALAFVVGRRRALFEAPWGRFGVALAVIWVALAAASGDLREGLGHAWLLSPLFAVSALRGSDTDTVERWGVGAACVAAAWALGQRALGQVGTGPMSHHLSLAYALLPPLGVAISRRWWAPGLVLTAGVLSTGSEGAVVAVGVTLAASLLPTRATLPAAGVGIVATLAALPFADRSELAQRAVLWTGGLRVAREGPVGPGAYPEASASVYEQLSPGFWFPNHAHDANIQALAVLGPAGLVATLALVVVACTRGARGAAAGIAGVAVGALTQDVFGDLEVARACWAWLALLPYLPDPDRGNLERPPGY